MSPIQPSRRQLLQEIRRNLGPAIGTSSLTRADRDLLYEASIWSLVWDAALTVGATCDLMDRTGVARGVVLRRAPSELSTRTANHTHVRISGSRSAVEAHQGIYLTGLSGAYHQADLAILQRMKPQACPCGGCDLAPVSLCLRWKRSATGAAWGSILPGATSASAATSRAAWLW